jgi:UDP-N-acetylglucosamine 2-epimerase (non-hydrolysing)
MTFVIVTGTRPEIVKTFPIVRLFELEDIDYKLVHTGQHHDYNLFLKFLKDFQLPQPHYNIRLTAPSGTVHQFSEILIKIGTIFEEIMPTAVIVEGDTNSVASAAIAAVKCKIPLIHVEAGLRSYDWRMPEEYNRKLTDHISDLLFTPTTESAKILSRERVAGRIHTVGNTVIDAVRLCINVLEQHSGGESDNILNSNYIKSAVDDFVLLTLHREENVDDRSVLKHILSAISSTNLNYICPMHPRTVKRIREFGLEYLLTKNIKVIEPVGYFDFLRLLKLCKFVITDSGGLQEEITSPNINKRALVLRDSTERPESLLSGHVVLCKLSRDQIIDSIQKIQNTDLSSSYCPYGDGYSAEKIIKILRDEPIIPLGKKNLAHENGKLPTLKGVTRRFNKK